MERQIERLSIDCVLPFLRERIAELNTVMATLSKSIACAPEGVLNVSPHRGGFQYFQVTSKTGRKGRFIRDEEKSLASELAQRDYDKKILVELQKQRSILEKCLAQYDASLVDNVYAQLHPARQVLVKPLVSSDEDFVKQWSAVEYAGREFDADTPMLVTARGERVRSKSEIMIADALFRRGIPYRYEFPHELHYVGWESVVNEDSHAKRRNADGKRVGKNSGLGKFRSQKRKERLVVYPDFTCLNVRTRQEFVWEHFGLIDVPEYCQNMASKMELYMMNGFCMGKNFLMTSETHDRPLSSMMVEAVLDRYFGEVGVTRR